MDVNELWGVLQWYNKHLGVKFPRKFTPLHSALNNNIQPNNSKQPVTEHAKGLTDFLRQVPIDDLTIAQLRFLADIEVASYIGEAGATKIEDLLNRSPIDPVAATNGVQEIINALGRAVERIGKLSSGLEGVVSKTAPLDDQAIVRVTFAHAAAMNNVVDMKKWGETWHDIARGISMARGAPPEDVRIVGASQGSIVIDLGVSLGIAKLFASIVNQALQSTNTLQDIRLKEEQIRDLRLKNEAAETALEQARRQMLDAAEKEKAAIVEMIVDGVVKHEDSAGNNSGENENALKKSVRLLVDFLDRGGNLDIVVKPTDKTAAENGDRRQQERIELERNAAAIRQLTRQIRALEHKEARNGNDKTDAN